MLPRTPRSIALLLVATLLAPACSSQGSSDQESAKDGEGEGKTKKKKPKASASAAATQSAAAPKPTATATAVASAPQPATAAATAAPVAAQIPALEVGQWIRFEQRDPEKMTIEYRVVRKASDTTFVLEKEVQALTQTTITELEIELKDRSTPDGMVINKARVKTPTGLVTLPPSGIAASQKSTQNDLVLPSLATGKQANVTVPAGTFEGCAVREHSESDPTGKLTATAYAHPSVPINGFVKYEGTRDGTRVVRELVGYGLTGAVAKL